MEAADDFLAVLGLGEEADARAVRRAYASKLKQIDQERDPAGFQALREAYEAALGWLAYKAYELEQGAEQDVQQDCEAGAAFRAPEPEAEPQVPTGPALDGAYQLAGAAIEKLMGAAGRLAEANRLDDEAAWEAELSARLAGDGLINITARALFEEQIAHLLANGWAPGHEALFPAAIAVFEWSDDRRRLAQLGYVGAVLNQAIDERAMFEAQSPTARFSQRRIAKSLRGAEPPLEATMARDMAELERMQARFPTLMQIIVPAANVDYWRAAYQAMPPEARRGRPFEIDESVAKKVVKPSSRFSWRALLPAILVMSLIPTIEYVRRVTEVPALPAPETETMLQRKMSEIAERIVYEPSPDSQPSERAVEYDVLLDADGMVTGLTLRQSSQVAGYDEAVATAIRASQPFPPGVARSFGAGFFRKAPTAPTPAPQ